MLIWVNNFYLNSIYEHITHSLKVMMGQGLKICELIGANRNPKEFRLLLDLGK